MPVEVLGLYVERKGVRKQQIQRRRDVARCIRTETCRCMQRGSATILKVIVFHQVYPSVAALRPLRKYCFVRKVQVRGCDVLFHGILLWYADLVKGSANGSVGPDTRDVARGSLVSGSIAERPSNYSGRVAPRVSGATGISTSTSLITTKSPSHSSGPRARATFCKSHSREQSLKFHSERNTTIDARPRPRSATDSPPKRGGGLSEGAAAGLNALRGSPAPRRSSPRALPPSASGRRSARRAPARSSPRCA